MMTWWDVLFLVAVNKLVNMLSKTQLSVSISEPLTLVAKFGPMTKLKSSQTIKVSTPLANSTTGWPFFLKEFQNLYVILLRSVTTKSAACSVKSSYFTDVTETYKT